MCGQQVLVEWVLWGVKQCIYIVVFNEVIVFYYCYVMCQLCYDVYVMCYQQQFQIVSGDNICQQVEDVCLGDGIEIGCWFVGDDKGCVVEQGESDYYLLQYVFVYFKRVVFQQCLWIVQIDFFYCCQQYGVICFMICCLVGFLGMCGYGLQWVKGVVWVLYDGGDGCFVQLFVVYWNVVEKYLVGGLFDVGWQQVQCGGVGQ